MEKEKGLNMNKRNIMITVIIFVLVILFKPLGSIKSYINLSDDAVADIIYIRDDTTNKVRYLKEEETEVLFKQLLNQTYYFKLSRNDRRFRSLDGKEYSFEMTINGQDKYDVAIDRDWVLIESDSSSYSFKIFGTIELYDLFEDLFERNI